MKRPKRYLITRVRRLDDNRTVTRYTTMRAINLADAEQRANAMVGDGETVTVALKKYKRPRHSNVGNPTTDKAFERKASEYARWIAARDNIALPDDGQRVHWSGVASNTRKNKKGRAIWERRIQAVTFNSKGGKTVYIQLPNWDWQPEATEQPPCQQESTTDSARATSTSRPEFATA